jgi:hypothetical protein
MRLASLALALMLAACARPTRVPLTGFVPTTETDSPSVSWTGCTSIGPVAGEALAADHFHRGARLSARSLDGSQSEAIAALKRNAARRGANYVSLEAASWTGADVVVTGTAHRCLEAPLPPVTCRPDGSGLVTCGRR